MTFLRCIRFILILLVTLVIGWHVYVLGTIISWRWINPPSSAFMRQQATEILEKDPTATISYQWTPYKAISSNLKQAVIASEDAKFVDHDGFDWESMEKAMKKNQSNQRRKKSKVIGGSTISQQLAKNMFLSPTQSYIRKAEEAIITLMLETALDKQRIFEIYLNVAEWGNGVFGAEAAAQHYFNISSAKLNQRQGAMLAAMLPNPRFYDTHRTDKRLTRKTQIILKRMRSAKIPVAAPPAQNQQKDIAKPAKNSNKKKSRKNMKKS